MEGKPRPNVPRPRDLGRSRSALPGSADGHPARAGSAALSRSRRPPRPGFFARRRAPRRRPPPPARSPKCEEARGRDYSRERNHKIFEEGGAGGIPVKGGMLDPGVTGDGAIWPADDPSTRADISSVYNRPPAPPSPRSHQPCVFPWRMATTARVPRRHAPHTLSESHCIILS